jgi:DNA-binding NtrC family response regulator
MTSTILIADRNSHVRMFLMRELLAEGYRVKVAANGANTFKMAALPGNIDLLILDPDLPGLESVSSLVALLTQNPALRIILHTHRLSEDEVFRPMEGKGFIIIEKAGNSVEQIKAVVKKLLEGDVSSKRHSVSSKEEETLS